MSQTPIVLDAKAVEKLLPQADVMAAIRRTFLGLGQKLAVQPPQSLTLLPDEKGDFITYLGAIASEGAFPQSLPATGGGSPGVFPVSWIGAGRYSRGPRYLSGGDL